MAAPGRRKRPSDRLNRTVSRLWAMRRAAGLEPVVYVKFLGQGASHGAAARRRYGTQEREVAVRAITAVVVLALAWLMFRPVRLEIVPPADVGMA